MNVIVAPRHRPLYALVAMLLADRQRNCRHPDAVGMQNHGASCSDLEVSNLLRGLCSPRGPTQFVRLTHTSTSIIAVKIGIVNSTEPKPTASPFESALLVTGPRRPHARARKGDRTVHVALYPPLAGTAGARMCGCRYPSGVGSINAVDVGMSRRRRTYLAAVELRRRSRLRFRADNQNCRARTSATGQKVRTSNCDAGAPGCPRAIPWFSGNADQLSSASGQDRSRQILLGLLSP
jgi:hypothetical protein